MAVRFAFFIMVRSYEERGFSILGPTQSRLSRRILVYEDKNPWPDQGDEARTVAISPLPKDVTAAQLKKAWLDCGEVPSTSYDSILGDIRLWVGVPRASSALAAPLSNENVAHPLNRGGACDDSRRQRGGSE